MKIAFILLFILACIIILIFHPSVNFKLLLLMIKPFRPFDAHKAPEQPDYSNSDNWASLPSKESITDKVPEYSSLKISSDEKDVDVFYIHRTTLLSNMKWNADIGSDGLNHRTEKEAIRNQASIFNESCNIYAPRYRQATLYSFFDKTGDGKKALDLAYQDIKAAFRHYLDHYNQGRPIIVAAHSQGAEHATRLLKDFFDEKDLFSKLVIAYLIGMPIHKDTFTNIPCSETESQTCCFVSWSTFGRGIRPNYFQDQYRTAVCTNPLTWNKNEEYGDFSKHLGSVTLNFKRIDKNIIDAESTHGVLWIRNRKKLSYIPLPLKNYVVMDIDLFYMNIRMNVKDRIDSYFKSTAMFSDH